MADNVEFKESQLSVNSPVATGSAFERGAVGAIIALSGGLIKNEKQAKLALVIIFSIAILLAVFILTKSFQSSDTEEVLKGISA